MGQFHLGRDTAPVLDGITRNVACIGGGTAGNDDDLVDGFQDRFINPDLVQLKLTIFVETPHQGIADCGRLVMDFFVHE